MWPLGVERLVADRKKMGDGLEERAERLSGKELSGILTKI